MAKKKSNNKNALLFAGGAIATIYLLQQKSSADTPPPPTTPSTIPSVPVLTMVSGIREDYKTAEKRDYWANRYKTLYLSDGEPTASDTVWQEFTSQSPFAEKFPTKGSLILNLATYREPVNQESSIGSFNIEADDTPVYDTWYNAFWQIDVWECNHWILWHEKNKQKYGQTTANNKFLDAWYYPDNWELGGNGYWCGDTCDFVNHFRGEGLDIANFGIETVCNLIEVPSNLAQTVSTVSQTASNTAQTLNWLLPIALVLGTGAFIYNMTKK